MNDIKTTSEVLDLAADAIQEHGWNQGWAPEDSRLCLIQAIGKVTDSVHDASFTRACDAIHDHLGLPSHMPSYEWNDAPDRTEEDVTVALRAAAAVERTKEAVYSDEDQPLPVEAGA